MEKKKGKIKEVNEQYDIMLEGEQEWLTPVDKVKQYVNESIIGSEVDLVIQNEKITFLKVLDGETKQDKGLYDMIEKINWNLGSISQTLKLSLLSDLESLKNTGAGRSLTQKKIYEALLKDCDKYLKVLKQIKEEQEK